MTKWYCLSQGGDIQYVGEFDTFEEADEFLDYPAIWIVDEEGARQWLQDLQQMLGEEAAPTNQGNLELK